MQANHGLTSILSLPASVSESEALRSFSALNISSVAWRIRKGDFQKMAAAYVPFCVYRVSYEMNRQRLMRFFALDQVQGVLDLFEFPADLQGKDLTPVETRNRLPANISAENAESSIREKSLRLIFQQGFFRLRQPNLQIERNPLQFHIPYWLGFYGEDGRLRCRVLDAVRGRMEGPKATQLFENWLAG